MDNFDKNLSNIDTMKILHSHKLETPPKWSWDSRLNGWSGYHLWWIVDGLGKLTIHGKTYDIEPGICFVLPMEETFNATQDSGQRLTIMGIHFDDPAPAPLPPIYNKAANIPFFSRLVDRAIEAHHAGELEAGCCWLQAALRELLRGGSKPYAPGRNIHRHEVETIAETLRQNPGQRLSLEEMAQRIPCSRDHLIRLFKTNYHCTPMEYQLRERMTAAENLLVFTNQNVSHIAEAMGYPDVYSFSKQFKQRHDGQSPQHYRKKSRSPKQTSSK